VAVLRKLIFLRKKYTFLTNGDTCITWNKGTKPSAPLFVLHPCYCVTSLQAWCWFRNTTSNDLTAFRMQFQSPLALRTTGIQN